MDLSQSCTPFTQDFNQTDMWGPQVSGGPCLNFHKAPTLPPKPKIFPQNVPSTFNQKPHRYPSLKGIC